MDQRREKEKGHVFARLEERAGRINIALKEPEGSRPPGKKAADGKVSLNEHQGRGLRTIVALSV